MSAFTIGPGALEALLAEACAAWPREACGVIIGDPQNAATQQFHPFPNLADRLHALDPERYPRDARTAYAMDPLKLQRLVDAAAERGQTLLAIAHSHPEHASYFSATDRAAAAPFGAPTWPETVQLVVSVFSGEARDLKGFGWGPDIEDWREIQIDGAPRLPGPPPGALQDGDV